MGLEDLQYAHAARHSTLAESVRQTKLNQHHQASCFDILNDKVPNLRVRIIFLVATSRLKPKLGLSLEMWFSPVRNAANVAAVGWREIVYA